MRILPASLAALLFAGVVPVTAVDVRLQAPLSTLVPLPGNATAAGTVITADLTLPADIPDDLGVGAYVTDRHGRWFQRPWPGTLKPGSQAIRIELGADDPATGQYATWTPAQAATISHGGLYFWSTRASHSQVRIENLRSEPLAAGLRSEARLTGLSLDGPVAAGERWSLRCLPQPFPQNPYAPEEFTLDLVVTTPSGATQRIPGFAELQMRSSDRGDREEVLPIGPERMVVRYRPREPGVHRLRLEATWPGLTRTVACDLDPLTVTGPAWDGYVHVDANDRRFFSVDGKLFWPRGPNLRAVTDSRCQENLGTRLTPDRGTLTYADFFARLQPSGANASEIWLSSWNLALEWRGDWPEFGGLGRYSAERAWRLDRILDLAWANGMRCNLVINNHGQTSDQVDREWHNNAYNTANGGIISDPVDFYRDPRALKRQTALRRYLAARYADHPAVLAWKLLSEQNLTAAGKEGNIALLATWQANACAEWKQLDTYGHPLTTHWSGDFRAVRPQVASLPGMDFLTIDAYHETAGNDGGQLLADLLAASTAPRGGLTRYGKPVLVSEFGGYWNACPEPQMIAEHASGAFVALVSGHAGGPMLWWFEWIDQRNRFQPYRAISNFIANEDLRNSRAMSLALAADDTAAPASTLWCRAWSRPGRLLGYLLDEAWQTDGTNTPSRTATAITIGDQIAAGPISVSWWDADEGRELKRDQLQHPGGALRLLPPPWKHHLAFKMWRE